jgi:transposase
MGAYDHTLALFQAALNLPEPWYVSKYDFSADERKLRICIDFRRGAHFPCPCCGDERAEPYDTEEREWRHLNFFEHRAIVVARVPRTKCVSPDCGEVKTISVPWAAKGSRFTLMFEAYIMALAAEMPVKAIADLVGEYDQRVWTIVHRNVEKALAKEDYSDVSELGLDETSSKRGHKYITVFVDLQKKKVLFATPGKDATTVDRFVDHLVAHNGDPKSVKAISSDMSQAFISGVNKHFPHAALVFDRFHIMKLIGQAVDEVRHTEAQTNDVLKKTRYLWLTNPAKLRKSQIAQLSSLRHLHLKTAKAYQIRLALTEFFEQENYSAGEDFLKRWYFWATHSCLEPIVKVAKTIKKHWNGILAWYTKRITNAILEGFNSLIQAAKARARGYRTTKNLITMVYLLLGKLKFDVEYVVS